MMTPFHSNLCFLFLMLITPTTIHTWPILRGSVRLLPLSGVGSSGPYVPPQSSSKYIIGNPLATTT